MRPSITTRSWLKAGGVLLLVLTAAVWAPAAAQVDVTGLWRPLSRNQDGSGMTGDSAGLPLTPNGQWRQQSWSPDDFDTAEWVCRPHSFDYSLEGPLSALRVWADIDRPTQRARLHHYLDGTGTESHPLNALVLRRGP